MNISTASHYVPFTQAVNKNQSNGLASTDAAVNQPKINASELNETLPIDETSDTAENQGEIAKKYASTKWQYELSTQYYATQKSAFDNYMGLNDTEEDDAASNDGFPTFYTEAYYLKLKKDYLERFLPSEPKDEIPSLEPQEPSEPQAPSEPSIEEPVEPISADVRSITQYQQVSQLQRRHTFEMSI